MVGMTGFEPATSWSQTKRATNCATSRLNFAFTLYQTWCFLSMFFEDIKRPVSQFFPYDKHIYNEGKECEKICRFMSYTKYTKLSYVMAYVNCSFFTNFIKTLKMLKKIEKTVDKEKVM